MDGTGSFLDGLVDLPPMSSSATVPTLVIKPEPLDTPQTTCDMNSMPSLVPAIKEEPCDNNTNSNDVNVALSSAGKDSTKPKSKPKKRKGKTEAPAESGPEAKVKIKQEKITSDMKVKKKRDRFNGMTEEEVLKRTLPDHLRPGLDIIIVGINPGLTAAYVGHHYAGPGNHFWKCLYLSGLIPEPLTAYDDRKLMDYGIGFTNIVERTSRGSADLTRKEIKEGGEILREKIVKYKPKIAVFNGKGIYEVFCGHKNFYIGKQPEPFPGTEAIVYVMPSSSARCSQLPRAIDKVPFYAALKKLRDHTRGDIQTLDDSEVCFPDLELKVEPKKIKEEPQENGVNEAPGAKKKRSRAKPKKEPNSSSENSSMMPVGVMPTQHMGLPGYPPAPFHPGLMVPPRIKQEPGQGGPGNCVGQTSIHPLNPLHVYGHRMPVLPDPNIDNLFANQPILVKQEDTSELSKYGLMPPNGLPPPLSHPPLLNTSPTAHPPLVPFTGWQNPQHSNSPAPSVYTSPPSTSSFSFTQMSSIESKRTSPAQGFQPWQQSPHAPAVPASFSQSSPVSGHTPPRMPGTPYSGSPGSYKGSPGNYNGSPGNWNGAVSPGNSHGMPQSQSPGHGQRAADQQGHVPSAWTGSPNFSSPQQSGQYQGPQCSPGSQSHTQGQFQGQLSPGHYPGQQLSPHASGAGQPGFSNIPPVQVKQEPGSAFGPCLSQH